MKVAIRRLVFERDRFCKSCGTAGSRGNPLTIHHIKPKFQFPELVNDPENLCVLCQHCHEIVHGICRKPEKVKKDGYWRREMAR